MNSGGAARVIINIKANIKADQAHQPHTLCRTLCRTHSWPASMFSAKYFPPGRSDGFRPLKREDKKPWGIGAVASADTSLRDPPKDLTETSETSDRKPASVRPDVVPSPRPGMAKQPSLSTHNASFAPSKPSSAPTSSKPASKKRRTQAQILKQEWLALYYYRSLGRHPKLHEYRPAVLPNETV